jgi:hypothetical protein
VAALWTQVDSTVESLPTIDLSLAYGFRIALLHVPWVFTTTIWTLSVEVSGESENCCAILVAFTTNGKAIINMIAFSKKGEEALPQLPALASVHKMICIADENKCVPCSRQKDVQALRRNHKTNVVVRITPCEGNDHHITLISLKVICIVSIPAFYVLKNGENTDGGYANARFTHIRIRGRH